MAHVRQGGLEVLEPRPFGCEGSGLGAGGCRTDLDGRGPGVRAEDERRQHGRREHCSGTYGTAVGREGQYGASGEVMGAVGRVGGGSSSR